MGVFDFLFQNGSGNVAPTGNADPTAPSFPNSQPTPFERATTGSPQGTLMGFLGSVGGARSNEEIKAGIQADIARELSSILEGDPAGGPARAVLKFMQTPKGHELLMRPGAADYIEGWKKAITPPDPMQLTTGPGQTSDVYQNGQRIGSRSVAPTEAQNYNAGVPTNVSVAPGSANIQQVKGQPDKVTGQPTTETQSYQSGVPNYVQTPPGGQTTQMVNGKPTQTLANAPIEVQTFNALTAKLGTVDPNILKTLVFNALNPNEVQQAQLSLQQLYQSGAISQEDMLKFSAKVYSIKQGIDDLGEPNGTYFLVDGITGKVKPITGTPGAAPDTGGGTPGVGGSTSLPSTTPGGQPHIIPPSARNPDGSINPMKLTDKMYMGLGVGPTAAAVSLAGTAVRWVNPSNKEEQSQYASMRRQQLDQLSTQVATVGAMHNGRLKTQTDQWLNNVPSKWTDPLDAYNKLGLLHDQVTALLTSEKMTGNDQHEARAIRIQSRQAVQALGNVLASMPTRGQINQMIGDLKMGTAGALTPASGARSLWELGTDAARAAGNTLNDLRTRGMNPPPGPTNLSTAPPQAPPQQPALALPSLESVGKMELPDITKLGDPTQMDPTMREAVLQRLRILQEQQRTKKK